MTTRVEPYMPIAAETGLLPCPFCGGEAVLTNVRQSNHSFRVGCYTEHCFKPATPYYETMHDAVTAWNKRLGDANEGE